MILWIRQRQAASQSMVYTEVYLENRDKAKAIYRTFGSWSKATPVACPKSDN